MHSERDWGFASLVGVAFIVAQAPEVDTTVVVGLSSSYVDMKRASNNNERAVKRDSVPATFLPLWSMEVDKARSTSARKFSPPEVSPVVASSHQIPLKSSVSRPGSLSAFWTPREEAC